MSVDISKYVDVSSERRSPVWNHMLLYKEKGDALCKLCLDKKITKTVQQGLEIRGLEECGPWRYTVFNWFPKHLRYTDFGQKP